MSASDICNPLAMYDFVNAEYQMWLLVLGLAVCVVVFDLISSAPPQEPLKPPDRRREPPADTWKW